MVQINVESTLGGLYKEIYAEKVLDLVPDFSKIIKAVPFSQATSTGNLYHQPVVLSQEHGFSYSGPSGGAITLNAAVAMTLQDAQIAGSNMFSRHQLGYEAAARASTSKKAFTDAFGLILKNALLSASKRLELSMLYGQSGLGKVASRTTVDSTNTTVTLTVASWADGIWGGLENATLQFYNATTLISSGADSIFTITSVNIATRTLSISGTSTGITALNSAVNSNPNVIDVYFHGSYGKEMVGLDKIITNTSTLFNINAGTYTLWAGNTFDAGSGPLSFGKLQAAIGAAVSRGLNEDATVYVNPRAWLNMLTDAASLRQYDSSYSMNELKNGATKLTFASINGNLNIEPHIFVKQGDAFIVPTKQLKRIGAQELSPTVAGLEGEVFLHLQDVAAYEFRLYANQAIFLNTPAKAVKITNIVNTTV